MEPERQSQCVGWDCAGSESSRIRFVFLVFFVAAFSLLHLNYSPRMAMFDFSTKFVLNN
jgi:hypothetical protein